MNEDEEDSSPVAVAKPLRFLPRVWLRGAARVRQLASQPVAWAWQDYAVDGTLVVLAGPPGGGKTTLLFLIILARSWQGAPLLDRAVASAPQGRCVILIEGEHGEASTARKLLKSAALLQIPLDDLDHIFDHRLIIVARKAVTLNSAEWRDVRRMIARGEVSDIAIDTIARVAPSDANDEAEQTAVFEQIAAALEKAPKGQSPIAWILAHTRKSGADALEDVSGSVQRVGQADSVIIVAPARDSSGKVTHSTIRLLKAREDPDEHPEAMNLEIAGEGVSWRSAASRKGAATTPLAEAERRVLAEARKHRERHTCKSHLADAAGGRKQDNIAAIDGLVTAGKLTFTPNGVVIS